MEENYYSQMDDPQFLRYALYGRTQNPLHHTADLNPFLMLQNDYNSNINTCIRNNGHPLCQCSDRNCNLDPPSCNRGQNIFCNFPDGITCTGGNFLKNQFPQALHQQPQTGGASIYGRNRYAPYTTRPYSQFEMQMTLHQQQQQLQMQQQQHQQQHQQQRQLQQTIFPAHYTRNTPTLCHLQQLPPLAAGVVPVGNERSVPPLDDQLLKNPNNQASTSTGGGFNFAATAHGLQQQQSNQPVTLQISNLDYTLDESGLRKFLLGQLEPITPVNSLVFEGNSYCKVTVPDLNYAKQVVSNLHRKKIGHKRLIVAYSRDSSQTELNALRCQVAGLLKDVPYCSLPMYKFRELFQSRFKSSISVLDLYKMQEICSITTDKNDEKFISLQPELAKSIEDRDLLDGQYHSVPFCTVHFKREQHKGWAEQDIEPLPNVFMAISDVQSIIYPLLKKHKKDIPIASLIHCIKGELGFEVLRNDNGVNLEHLICCVQGIQITTNHFGIKILAWLEPENVVGKDVENRLFSKNGSFADPLYQISREVIELVKMCPKSTMKFNRFIPAYHNHFGKQCRVADYGYTRLIELFEALSSVVQVMGDGENRQITLTHRIQSRRFTSVLLRVLRAQTNKSIFLSELAAVFQQTQNRNFDITDYGVCQVLDILDGLIHSNTVVVTNVPNTNDILISIPKRKQTTVEVERTSLFAGEVIELFRNAPQYSIPFQKFVRSYHYHFGFQCRLSDYGYFKLADLMDAIQGIVEVEFSNEEDKRIYLSVNIAQRVFADQLEDLVKDSTGYTNSCIKLEQVLELHKKKFGYQIVAETFNCKNMIEVMRKLPFVELLEADNLFWITSHKSDVTFRDRCYKACIIIDQNGKGGSMVLSKFLASFQSKHELCLRENDIKAMHHAIELTKDGNGIVHIKMTNLMKFLIKIIHVIEPRYRTVTELKSTMNLGITDCFEFGYSDLTSLLQGFPEIFSVDGSTSAPDRCAVSLISHSELKNGRRGQRYSSTGTGSALKTKFIVKEEPDQLQPFSGSKKLFHLNRSKNQSLDEIKENIPMEQSFCADKIGQADLLKRSACCLNEFEMRNPMPRPPPGLGFSYNPQNVPLVSKDTAAVYQPFNGSLNSSGQSDPNLSGGSLNNFSFSTAHSGETMGLMDTRHPQLLDFCGAGTASLQPFTDLQSMVKFSGVPPKPDSPSNSSTPFWVDPIWSNTACNDDSSKRDQTLNIRLPELKSYNLLPVLMSPYSQSKAENMKKMFSFENMNSII